MRAQARLCPIPLGRYRKRKLTNGLSSMRRGRRIVFWGFTSFFLPSLNQDASVILDNLVCAQATYVTQCAAPLPLRSCTKPGAVGILGVKVTGTKFLTLLSLNSIVPRSSLYAEGRSSSSRFPEPRSVLGVGARLCLPVVVTGANWYGQCASIAILKPAFDVLEDSLV